MLFLFPYFNGTNVQMWFIIPVHILKRTVGADLFARIFFFFGLVLILYFALQSDLYILFEHAAGYAVFRVKEFEEVGMLLPQVEESVADLSRFNSVVKLISFYPFKSAASALENINSISEGKYIVYI